MGSLIIICFTGVLLVILVGGGLMLQDRLAARTRASSKAVKSAQDRVAIAEADAKVEIINWKRDQVLGARKENLKELPPEVRELDDASRRRVQGEVGDWR